MATKNGQSKGTSSEKKREVKVTAPESGIVNIHGKDYMTVARRIGIAHEDKALEGVETEIVSHEPIVVRAKVTIKGKTYTGMSAVIPENARTIERQNPYEVAETSAVGRALGFAGYGLIESVATADELVRVSNTDQKGGEASGELFCEVCGAPAQEKEGTSKQGRPYHAIFCSTGDRTHTLWL